MDEPESKADGFAFVSVQGAGLEGFPGPMQLPVDSYAADLFSQAAVARGRSHSRASNPWMASRFATASPREPRNPPCVCGVEIQRRGGIQANERRTEPHVGMQQPGPELTSRDQHCAGGSARSGQRPSLHPVLTEHRDGVRFRVWSPTHRARAWKDVAPNGGAICNAVAPYDVRTMCPHKPTAEVWNHGRWPNRGSSGPEKARPVLNTGYHSKCHVPGQDVRTTWILPRRLAARRL